MNAAVRQMENIDLISDTIGMEKIPESLLEAAELRLEYPDATLIELGKLMQSPLGKSGVNHRMRKLEEIAEKIRGNKP